MAIQHIGIADETIQFTIVATSTFARCPACRQSSDRVHSRYDRRLIDLPIRGLPVVLQLRVRRFFCRQRDCTRRVFAERLSSAEARSRRTRRLRATLREIALADGGEAGSRLAQRLGMPASPAHLLQLIRRGSAPEVETPRVLGVDEWAKRRGRSYGTILVDLEERRVVDPLDEATAGAFATWLRDHPGVEVISRDRGGTFADGACAGAPNALQVADRWHLLKNLGDAVESFLHRIHRHLPKAPPRRGPSQTATRTTEPVAGGAPDPWARRLTRKEQERQRRRDHRLDRYEAVVALERQGLSLRAIARTLDLNRATVRRYLRTGAFPEMTPRRRRPSILDPYRAYLNQRWDDGCRNGTELLRELRERGYTGGRSVVADAVRALRVGTRRVDLHEINTIVERTTAHRVSPRRARWWFVRPADRLAESDRADLDDLLAEPDEARIVYDLAQRFGTMVRERRDTDLPGWIVDARGGPREMRAVAAGIECDRPAVEAALTERWSQGQTEGQIHRLKLMKRKMYSRAKLDLLRHRVLEAG